MAKTKQKKLDKVICSKHGLVSCVQFSHDNVLVRKVCFICWVDKITKGLYDFKVDEMSELSKKTSSKS